MRARTPQSTSTVAPPAVRAPRSLLQWFVANFPLMLLSFLLACLAWVTAMERQDPTLEQRYSQPIPIVLTGLSRGMVVVGEFKQNAQFTLRAPESVWRSIEPKDFTASVDVAGMDAGTWQLEVEWTFAKEPARVVHIEPEYVTLTLETEVTRPMTVEVEIVGEPTLGYVRKAEILTPTLVTVTGPSSYVAQVARVTTRVSVQDAVAAVQGDFRLSPQDGAGQPTPLVRLLPETARVYVPIVPSNNYRSLIVKAVLTGTCASGYRITNISVQPPSVTVFGLPGALNQAPGYIETWPINIADAQADIVARPMLNLPASVSLVSTEQPVVRISVEPIQSSLTVAVTPTIQGLTPGYSATVSPATVELILSGPMAMLDALQPGDVRVILELFGLEVGKHQIEPKIVTPQGISAQSVLPSTVQVEITVAVTPTPAKGSLD